MKKSVIIVIILLIASLSIVIISFSPNFTDNRTMINVDFGCQGKAQCFQGMINQIIDGDTIVVNDIHVRLSLTSTPELDEAGGIEAKHFTEKICPIGSDALVDEDDGQTQGSYGRTIAKVYCGTRVLNSELLENKYASIDDRFCSNSEFGSDDWATKFGC